MMELPLIDRYAMLLHKLLRTEEHGKLPTGTMERKMVASLKNQYKKFIEQSSKELKGPHLL
jgi:hypothetical protein